MTPIRRRVAAVSAPVLLALSLTACGGGGSGAPDDASAEDFCATFLEISTVEDGADIKDFGEKLEEVGTPEDINEDERAGFEVFVEALSEVDDDASIDDIEEPDISEEDDANGDAFLEYASTTCADQIPDELPTE